jgi:hypothetical protein
MLNKLHLLSSVSRLTLVAMQSVQPVFHSTTRILFLLPLCAAFLFAGCHKSEKPTASATQTTPSIDIQALDKAFPSPSKDMRPSLNKIEFDVRYGNYADCLAELEKLASGPGLSDAQKKAVSTAMEQTKGVMNNSAPH